MKKLFLISIISLNVLILNAQFTVSYKVQQISWSGFDGECSGLFSDGSEIRFEINVVGGSPSTNYYTFNCLQNNGGCGSGSSNFNHNFNYAQSTPFYHTIKIHGWEDDGCGDCNWDPGCDDDDGGLLTFGNNNLDTIAPEKYITINSTTAGSDPVGAIVWAKYSFPSIDSPLIYRKNLLSINVSSPPIICPSDTLYLKTDYHVLTTGGLINGIKTGVKFKWEVNLNNGIWKIIDTTMDSIFKFIPKDKFIELDTMFAQGNMGFKVTAIGVEASRMSNISYYTIMPRAPRATVIGYAACFGQNNGKIELKYIDGIDNRYRFILKSNFNNIAPCNPDSNNCFVGQVASGTNVTPPDYVISNVDSFYFPAGQYTLWLINSGGYKGSCYNTYNVEVPVLPNFQITLDSTTNVSCKNGNDGAIYLHSNKTFPVYSIQPLANATSASYIVQDTIFKIQNLKQGSYLVSVKDYCNIYTAPINVTIIEPTRVVGNITQSISPSCVTPANGSITMETDSGSGLYNYLVYKSGILVSSLLNTSTKIYQTTNLSEGTYKIEIQDAMRPTCPGYISFVDLTYPSTITFYDSIVNLSCFQSNNGQIILNGQGNISGFKYALFSYATSSTVSNTSGQFSNLSQGFYKEILKRNITGCLDSVVQDSIYVSQPNLISTTITKKNVSCLGNDDGYIAVSASGGTPNYLYQWEFKNSSGWSLYSTSSNPSTLTNLYPAIYRVKIVDANLCNSYSDSVDVREPNALQFDSIQTHNIKCFGETATIQCYASGGTPPYSYSFSLDNGTTFTPFVASTGLYSGTYKIKLNDANNCSVIYPTEQIINSPSQPLSLDNQLSDFNGYNISCKNGSNGTIILAAKGGNENGYTGYSYSVNSGLFTSNSSFNSLTMGNYIVKVKDGRDCIVSKTITLTEPNELISSVQSIDTIKCGNDSNGRINISNVGGVSPYNGKIIGVTDFMKGTIFTNLSLNNYQLEIKDANGCLDTVITAMESKYPKLLYNYATSDVKCYGGSTGNAQLNPYGGVAPYQYNWINTPLSNKNTIENLSKGNYSFEIIDDVDCNIMGTISISEPQILEFSVDEVPVCPKTTTGEFRINARGGIKPYQYSIDSINYSLDRIITNISPNSDYKIFLKDSNLCNISKKASITIFPETIFSDFLISTNEMTQDTIRAVDITKPKPDSIHWTYSNNTNIISKNNSFTEVYYNSAGVYNITMKTFNNFCENTVSKNSTIKIKDTSIYRPNSKSVIDSFTVYPVPNNGVCTLYLTTSKIYPLIYTQVINNQGNILYTKRYNDVKLVDDTINLSSLAKGSYYLRVFVENEYRIKIIIIE